MWTETDYQEQSTPSTNRDDPAPTPPSDQELIADYEDLQNRLSETIRRKCARQ